MVKRTVLLLMLLLVLLLVLNTVPPRSWFWCGDFCLSCRVFLCGVQLVRRRADGSVNVW